MALTNLKRHESVANVLKRLREKAGLTTRQAAGIIGVTHTTISHYERGEREFTSLRIEQLDEEQLAAVRSLLYQLLRQPITQNVANSVTGEKQLPATNA